MNELNDFARKQREYENILSIAGFKDMPLLYEISKLIKRKFNFLLNFRCTGKSVGINFLKFENDLIEYNYIFSSYRWDFEFKSGKESFVKGDYGNVVVNGNFDNIVNFFMIDKKTKLMEFHSYDLTTLVRNTYKTFNYDCLNEFEDYVEIFKKNEIEFNANEKYISHVISYSDRYKKLDNQFIQNSFIQANKFISSFFLKGKEIKRIPDFLDLEYIKKKLMINLILKKHSLGEFKRKGKFFRNDSGEEIIKVIRTDNVLTIFIMSWNYKEFNLILYMSSIFHTGFSESKLVIINSFFDNINIVRSRYNKHILKDENQIINWIEMNELIMKTQLKDSIDLINLKYNEENSFVNELSSEFLHIEKQESELKRIQKLF